MGEFGIGGGGIEIDVAVGSGLAFFGNDGYVPVFFEGRNLAPEDGEFFLPAPPPRSSLCVGSHIVKVLCSAGVLSVDGIEAGTGDNNGFLGKEEDSSMMGDSSAAADGYGGIDATVSVGLENVTFLLVEGGGSWSSRFSLARFSALIGTAGAVVFDISIMLSMSSSSSSSWFPRGKEATPAATGGNLP
eukprot:CAMPEP_0202462956 /NCGR_PEP_ID=MMETSP1360-20130828/56110_1 /ASSEMBLY_ACC=CAM_ASM_000848 /TAXON_ID=515479 /ORGANISM="Licmophora paradoxa, Strain CCMP2313" /LENGTH=187 /DNA_ID=CAMNT_0049085637 /DNA_START=183 /DNA_END=744 /DNA_ORIENTATION=+